MQNIPIINRPDKKKLLRQLLKTKHKKTSFTMFEIGAMDGTTLSNTLTLEKDFGWTGLLVEAHPRVGY